LPSTGPKAYVGVFKDNNVTVIDTMTNKVLGIIPIPAGPHSLVFTADGRKLFVSSDGASTVSVIDTSTDKVIGSIEVGTTPHGLALTPDGRWLLVAVFGTNMVAFIDTSTDTVISQVPVGSPHNIGISPDGKLAYVASQAQGKAALVILDISAKTQVGTVALDKVPRALNFSPDGKQVYFTQAGIDAVQVLDPLTNKVTTQIPVGASPHHPLFTPNGEYALVVDQGPGELAIIDPAKNTLSRVVPVGKNPHWIAGSSDGDTAWVTDEGSNEVTVVDVEHAKAIATIPVGNGPRKIVVQPVAAHSMTMPAPTAVGGVNSTVAASQTTAAVATTANAGAVGGKVSVSIKGFAFNPGSITIKSGQTITWTNNDSVPHTVTSKDGRWDSGDINPGASFSRTFEQEGSFAYYCTIHPSMLGEVIVKS
jgi:YVTN family beta-propeller protein